MLVGNNNEEKIWNFLSDKLKNGYGVAGLMGNLFAESALIPTNLQNTYNNKLQMTDVNYTQAVDTGVYKNFIRDSAGYGLAQWTYWSRKQCLYNYAKAQGKSIGDLEMQLNFLWNEISGSYKNVLSVLKNATSVEQASYIVLTEYEKPANQGLSVQRTRKSYGDNFFNKYHNKNTSKDINIKQMLTEYNHKKGSTSRIKYIVIHYVGALGGALANCKYFASGNIGTSAHYFIDFNGDIYQSVLDENIAFHCGSGIQINNSNSIGIEMCVRKKDTYTLNDTDRDWYFEKETVEATINLTKYLMKKYNIPADNVVRHFDVTGKICPNPYVYNHTKHTWSDFKTAIGGSITKENTPFLVTVTAHELNVRKQAGVNYPVVTTVKKGEVYTIVDTVGDWGKLKSGVGYINLKYTTRK